jgi:hypothetical protein
MIYVRDEGDIRGFGFNFYPWRSNLLGFVFVIGRRAWFFYYNKKKKTFIYASI